MDRIDAIRLLESVWGSLRNINPDESSRLESLAQPGESALQTCGRLAGLTAEETDVIARNAFRPAYALMQAATARRRVRAAELQRRVQEGC